LDKGVLKRSAFLMLGSWLFGLAVSLGLCFGLFLWNKPIINKEAGIDKPAIAGFPTLLESKVYGDAAFDLAIQEAKASVGFVGRSGGSGALIGGLAGGGKGGLIGGMLGAGAGRGGAVGGAALGGHGRDLTLEAEQTEYLEAIRNAKTGSIQFYVAPVMTVGESETVIVQIYGPMSPEKQKRDFKATGSGVLKVITPMLVALSQPDNPGGFQIQADASETGNQFLPTDSFAEWSWTVSPLRASTEPKKLRITAYLVFNAKLPSGSPAQVQISSYTVTVATKVEPKGKAFAEWFSDNWKDVLKYVLPTGAGSALLLWLAARLLGKSDKPAGREKDEKKEAEEEDDGPD
jgi:hypothetical protein